MLLAHERRSADDGAAVLAEAVVGVTSAEVDACLGRAKAWRPEMARLREILLDGPLDEALKWGKPCYAFEGGNVAILQPFKASVAVMFFKGSLLDDPGGLLVAPGENSQAGRRLEVGSVAEVDAHEAALRGFVEQAIALERSGAKVDFSAKRELALPEELVAAFGEDPELERAFEALTPGRQRGWVLQIAAAKQSATRTARIARARPEILEGKGPNDR